MKISEQIKAAGFCLDSINNSSDCLLLSFDQEYRITGCNEESYRLLKLRPEQLLGQKLNQPLKLGYLQTLIMQNYCFKGQPLLIDGRQHFCDFSPLEQNNLSTGGLLAVYREEQRATRTPDLPDLLSTLKQHSFFHDDSLILVNPEGIITLINQSFADPLGIRAIQMIGKHVLQAYPNSSPSRLPVVMETGQSEEAEPHMLNGHNAVVSRYPLLKDGKMIGALGKILFHDIRELTRLTDKFHAFINQPEKMKKPAQHGGHHFKYDCNSIIGQSPVMKDLKGKLLRIAQRPSNVLLTGESGTGKELFAHAIHAASKRRHAPFVRVNCAAIPEQLMEAELFGYVDGAFTGARRGGQTGKFEQAHSGTIFLDEISEMPPHMQAKMLRVLQEKEVTPLGSTQTRKLDIRVIAATNVTLEQQVAEGKFRTDLYYRLNVIALEIPPLRDRREDIYFITKHLIDNFNGEFDLNIQGLTDDAWKILKSYNYPGNIRELRNAVESAFNMANGPLLDAADLPQHIRLKFGVQATCSPQVPPSKEFFSCIGQKPLQEIMEELEQHLLEATLDKTGGNKMSAANLLGISRPGLYKKLNKFNLN
ncbi:MAG: sigma-54-dependent Fis family transcriptional regulator [Desulfuromonas sp.]|nr:MAG: sigma-54-dependent Fis family transcriptional regulator [Desulfuromonas sp.]